MSVNDAIRFTSKFYATWRPELAERLKADFSLRGEKRIKNLSAGMRTKLSLLLAIAHEPRLLILDEPTSGLDPIFRVDLLEYLVDLRKSAQNLSIRSRPRTLCLQGNCAISCSTIASSGQASAKARMYFRLLGLNPSMPGNSFWRSWASLSITRVPQPSVPYRASAARTWAV